MNKYNKILSMFLFVLFIVILSTDYKNEVDNFVFAQNFNQCVICLDNFDSLDNETKKEFENIDCNLTFVSSNYKSNNSSKMIIHFIKVPKSIMLYKIEDFSIEKINNTIFNSISTSINCKISVLVFDMANCDSELVYYSIIDNLSLFSRKNVKLCTFQAVYDFVL